MELSLLSRTDIFTMRPLTTLVDYGSYAVFRTPAARSYYSGNSLLLADPLTPATLSAATALFADAFADTPVRHVRIEWNGPDPTSADLAAYAAAGFSCETILCMALTSPAPPAPGPPTPDLTIQPVQEADLGLLKRFLLDCHDDWGAPFVDFTAANILRRHQTLDGGWWLAWLDGHLVGSMGLFFDDNLGRFQLVDTHPAYRRRGIARTLLTHLIAHGLARPQTAQLVIAADRDYFAAQFYADCGFRLVHTQHELLKHPAPEEE